MFVKGQKAIHPFKKGHKPWNTGLHISGRSGHKLSEKSKKVMSAKMLGRQNPKLQHEKHPSWKGNEASYRSIHKWVSRWKEESDTCENCGISGLKGHSIHWANIDHKYRRVLDDYIHLCVKCHDEYDSKLGINKK